MQRNIEGFYGEDIASTADLQRVDRDLYFVQPSSSAAPNISMLIDTVANIAVLFDGHIYNKSDFGFDDDVPNCDVVASLFKKHGICFVLSYLDGAFAFALADMQTTTEEPSLLYLCRDVGGSRPLFYNDSCFQTATPPGPGLATEVQAGSYALLRLKWCVHAKWELKSPQVFYHLPCLPLKTRFDKQTLRYMFKKVINTAVEKIAAVVFKPVFLIRSERATDTFRLIKRYFVENLDIELGQGPDTVAFVSSARRPYLDYPEKEIYYPLLDRDVVQLFTLFPHFMDILLDPTREPLMYGQIKSAK